MNLELKMPTGPEKQSSDTRFIKTKTRHLAIFMLVLTCISAFFYITRSPTDIGWSYSEVLKDFGSYSLDIHKISNSSNSSIEENLDHMYNNGILENVDYKINGTDVMVFLHIQKTGGTTFGLHLVKDLHLKKKCVKSQKDKRYDCFRPNTSSEHWLFSRYTTGWKCGLHAGWTSLNFCVHEYFSDLQIKRRYFYFTIVREPIARYLSEFAHVRRGATWKTAYMRCNGHRYQTPLCFEGEDWWGVSLQEFMSCQNSWATNRQTRMLSNLTIINCTGDGLEPMKRDQLMLESAKENLLNMAVFGLTEEQDKSRLMFEYVFGMKFKTEFISNEKTIASRLDIVDEDREKVKKLNYLDIELYKFAKELFYKRWEYLTSTGLITS